MMNVIRLPGCAESSMIAHNIVYTYIIAELVTKQLVVKKACNCCQNCFQHGLEAILVKGNKDTTRYTHGYYNRGRQLLAGRRVTKKLLQSYVTISMYVDALVVIY